MTTSNRIHAFRGHFEVVLFTTVVSLLSAGCGGGFPSAGNPTTVVSERPTGTAS
jgi:hypothetical protein